MIVAAHQPLFLPWLGYLDRMQQADMFIILDHVQFARRNYQNRTHIRLDGKAHWLTVPVQQHSIQERIMDKRIEYPENRASPGWGQDVCKTLRHAYRAAPFVEDYVAELQPILESRWDRLLDLNLELLGMIRDALEIRTPLAFSSELAVAGTRSELILNLCQAVGADTYVAGMGGSRQYLDQQAFAEAGVRISWQDFRHPVYSQGKAGDFIGGLSSVDLLFNHGPRSREILFGAACASSEPGQVRPTG